MSGTAESFPSDVAAPPAPTRKSIRLWPSVPLYGLATYAVTATGTPEADALNVLATGFGITGQAAEELVRLGPPLIAVIGFALLALLARRPKSWARIVGSAGVGMVIGFSAAMTMDLFTRTPWGLGLPQLPVWQGLVLVMAAIAILLGTITVLAVLRSSLMPEAAAAVQYQGSAMSGWGGAAYVLQGITLVVLVWACQLDWAVMTPLHWTLVGAVGVLLVCELCCELMSWHRADERFRSFWLECMGLTFVLGFALLALTALAQATGQIAQVPMLGLLAAGHALYLIISFTWAGLRAPDIYTGPMPEEPA